MFADDTIIYSNGQSISEIQSKLQMAIDSVIPWYESNRLAVNTEKSSVMLIGKKTQIRDNNLNIYINNVLVNETNCTKYLGLFIDTILSWDVQCDNLCRHISGKIAVLRRVSSFIKPSIMKLIYDRTIQPVIDYGYSVWYNTISKNLKKLQKVQNYAARIISGNFDYINVRSISLIRSLKWMTISERCEYFTALLMFKAINGLVPNYLSDSIVMAGESHDRDTRLSESLDVHIPSHNSSALKRSFIYNGSVLWNALPEEIKTVYSHLKRDTKSKSKILCSISKFRKKFKEPSLQIVLWSLHCFVLFSFVFYMTYHLYFIWIVIHCSYTEAIMFLIIELLLLKMDFMYFEYFMCVEVMCVHRTTWENSQWLNVLPSINILEKNEIK